MIFYKFQALENIDYSYKTFSQHAPYYVKKAGSSAWGTCLCRTCLNPELKIEKLIQEKLIPSINLEYVIQNDDDYCDLLENVKRLEQKPSNLEINCVKWNLVSQKGKCGKETKISRKEVSSFPLCGFAKELAIELAVLKDHLYRAHMQYRAFKTKRMGAEKSLDNSKPKGWGQRKVQTMSPSKLIGPRMLASIRHKRKNLPIITLIKYLSIVLIHDHHKTKNRLLQYQITQIIRLVLFLQALNQFY